MIFAEIEQAIAAQLAPLRELGIATRAMPNKPAEWGMNENGIITLKWEKDDCKPPDSMGRLSQQVLMTWELDIRLRNLRDANGAWIVMQEVTRLLLGFRPPHCDKLYLKSREFVGELEGIWVLEVIFVAPTWVIEAESSDSENPEVPLSAVFFVDSYGGLEVGTV